MKMKVRNLWWLTLSLAAQGLGQETAPTVTLETKAASVQSVIDAVVKQTGLKIEAGTLKDWPVIVRVKNMPAKAFLDTLGKVLDAEWTRLGDTVTLSRGAHRLRIAEAAEAEARLPWVTQAVDKYLKDTLNASDWSQQAIDKRLKDDAAKRAELLSTIKESGDNMRISMIDNESVTPGALVLNEALRKLPAKSLAGILPGQRIVWANVPNRMQKQLPYVPGSLDPFVRAYNRVLEANKALADAAPQNVRIETALSKRGEPIQAVAKLIVIGQRFGDGLQVSVLIVGKNGEVLDRPQAWLGEPPTPAGIAPDGISGEAVLSEQSKNLIRAFRTETTGTNQMQVQVDLGDNLDGSLGNDPPLRILPQGVAAILSNPVANEPMSYFPSEVLLQLAQSQDRNLIGYLPDASFGAFAQKLAGGKMSFADLFRNAPSLGLAITEGETITVSPANWAQADRSRVNRAELGKVTGAVAKRGYASLDELARYALAMPRWSDENLDAIWLAACAPVEHRKYSANQNVFYKMYGSLTTPQRQPAAARASIMANQMSAQQKLLLEEIVYQAGGPQMIGRGRMMTTSVGVSRGNTREQEPQEPEIVIVEPTEAFPNGLPPNTRLELNRRFSDGVYAIDAQGRGRFLSAGDLGLRMGIDKGTLPPGMNVDSEFNKYFIADLTTVEMNVQFGRRGRTASLKDASVRSGASAVSYAQLPKNFTDNVDRARQRAMNMKMMSVGGRGAPPP